MKDGRAQQISNVILSGMAGFSSFVFSRAAFLYVKELDAKVVASIVAVTLAHNSASSAARRRTGCQPCGAAFRQQ